uniref:Uncharacterized protein n=1 Tax=Acrobeloides nanus TaxID=290746 RepID=A0A914CRR4_9BILA
MEGFILVLVLSLTMFLGSYCAGYIPLAITMSESRIRLLSIVGAGLLVGTSLAVILPEGLEALKNSPSGIFICF